MTTRVPERMLGVAIATQAELDAEITARGAAVAQEVTNRNAAIAAAPQLTAVAVQATTSGTSKDFLSIPSWAKRITVSFAGVSTSGTSVPILQLGDSGGIEATGYLGSAGLVQNAGASATALLSSGFAIMATTIATAVFHGAITLTLQDPATNTWVAAGAVGRSDVAVPGMVGGSKALSAALDRLRITTVNGTDTFDAGSVSVMYD